MRWLQNFPRSPDVIHAVVVALEDWISLSPDNRDRIVRDGHMALLCKIFAVLDINSRPFVDLLSVMDTLVCGDETSLVCILPSLDLTSASLLCRTTNDSAAGTPTTMMAVKSMLSCDIHIDLMRILTYKINSTVDQIGLRLLVHLLAGMDAVCLRQFVRVDNPLARVMMDREGSCLDDTSDASALAGGYGTSHAVTYLQAMLNLAYIYWDLEGVVGVVCDVCVKLICWPAYSSDEQLEHVNLLVDAGVVDILAKLLRHYCSQGMTDAGDGGERKGMGQGRMFTSPSAVFKCVTFLAKLACRYNREDRTRLLGYCLSHLTDLLRGWHRRETASEFSINGDVLFATCGAVGAILFGTSSPGLPDTLDTYPAIENLDEICTLLEYRWQLHNISHCCVAACPTIEPIGVKMGAGFTEVRQECMFGLIRRHAVTPPAAAVSVLQVTPPESFAPFSSGMPRVLGNGVASDLSLCLTVSSADVRQEGSAQLMIVREVDVGKFTAWCALAYPDASMSKTGPPVSPSFPFVKLDMETGNVTRCGVSGGMDEDHDVDCVEELMPLSVVLDNTKRFRVDVGHLSAGVCCNGLSSRIWTFPNTLPDHVCSSSFDDECSNARSGFPTDRAEEKTGNGVDALRTPVEYLSAGEDTAERFVSCLFAAASSENRLSAPPQSPLRTPRSRSGPRRTRDERRSRNRRVQFDDGSTSPLHEDVPGLSPRLAVFMLLTPPSEQRVGSVQHKSDAVLISALMEKASLGDDEVTTVGSTNTSTSVPIKWLYRDDRCLQVTDDNSTVQHCASPIHGKVQDATAITVSTHEGVHFYQFNVASADASFALGVCTAEIIPNFKSTTPPGTEGARLTQFSIEYASSGLIQVSMPGGLHPFSPLTAAKTSALTSGDIVHVLLVQDGAGSVRFFRNHKLVFVMDNLSTACCPSQGLSAFVCLSHPGDKMKVTHTVPDLVGSVNWKWLDGCFSCLRDRQKSDSVFQHLLIDSLQRCDALSQVNKGAYLSSYSPHDNCSDLLSLLVTISIAKKQTRNTATFVAAVNHAVALMHRDSGHSFKTVPSPCDHEHTPSLTIDMLEYMGHCDTPVLTKRIMRPRWTVACPPSHDISMALFAIFSAVFTRIAHSDNESASAGSSLRRAMSGLVAAFVTGSTPMFPPSILLNLGAGRLLAEFIPLDFSHFEQDEWRTLLDVITFVSAALNCDCCGDLSGSYDATVPHLLVSSGLIKRLGYVCNQLLDSDCSYDIISWQQKQELSERICPLIGMVVHRSAGNERPRHSSREQPVCMDYDAHRYLQLLQQLVQDVSWDSAVSKLLSSRIASVPEISYHCEDYSLPSMLSGVLLSLTLAASTSFDASPCLICFDSRAQSTAHIWHQSMVNDKNPVMNPSDVGQLLSATESYIEEVRVALSASTGDPIPLLNRDGEMSGWMTDGVALPQWIDIRIPSGEIWTDIELHQQVYDDQIAPQQCCIRVGTENQQHGFLRDLKPGSTCRAWQTLITSGDVNTTKANCAVRETTIRVELLRTFGGGNVCSIAGLRVVSKIPMAKSLLGLRRAAMLPTLSQPNIIDVIVSRKYTPINWRENLYFSLLEGRTHAVESIINGRELECCQLHMFAGYGPWLWGHPGNIGNMALCVPCSVFSAVEQMIECGYSNPTVFATLLRSLNPSKTTTTTLALSTGNSADGSAGRSGNGDQELVLSVDGDGSNTELAETQTLSDVMARLTSRYGRLNHMSSESLGPHMFSMATVATIAAIRSIVRDEQVRIVQLSQSLGLDTEALEQSVRSLRQTGERLSAAQRDSQNHVTTSMEGVSSKRLGRIPPPGPNEFMFKLCDGREGVFDASHEACRPFGLFHGQKVRSHCYPELGQGTVIGVLSGMLWIHLDKDAGASYRRDNWQYADLYVLGSELQLESSGPPSQAVVSLQGRSIKIGNRVRRGRSWQWHNQDGYMGNMGTVVDGASNDFWVSVEWDGGGRNTYRWGADGQYDLEIVDDSIKTSLDVAQQCQEGVSTESCETLLAAEKVRRKLHATCGGLVADLVRHAARNGHVELYRRSMSAVCYLACYDLTSARSLGLSLDDVLFCMHGMCGTQIGPERGAGVIRGYSDRLNCSRLLSVLTTVGYMPLLLLEKLGGRTFPFEEVVTTLKLSGRCSPLMISALCFLRLLIQMGTSFPSSRNTGYINSLLPNPLRRTGGAVHDIWSDGIADRPIQTDRRDRSIPESNFAESKSAESAHDVDNDIANCIETELHKKSVLDDLLEILLPVLCYHQSASAVVIVVDILSSLLTVPQCFPVLVAHGIDAVLVGLANQLHAVEVTGSSIVIFQLVMKVMISIEQRAEKPMPSLLQAILQFANQAKDYETVVQMLNSHIDSGAVVCRCVEILIGGRRRYLNRVATSQTWRRDLTVGSTIDAKDKSQLWYEAVIKNTNDNDELFVHYMGWGTKYDEWISRSSDRIQIPHSETGYWRENLRLDDPVEILCLHHEGSEVKRRWFRGVVTRMIWPDKLLIEYDKRGCCEERWVNLLDGEEVCKVGTHVPSGLGPSSELLKSQRKKRLLQCNTFQAALMALERHIDDEETALACLEAIQYLISEDEDIALTSHQLMSLKPAGVLCDCVAIHAIRSDVDGNGGSEDIVEGVCSVLLSLCTSQDTKNFAVGDAVDAQWKRRGNQAFPARILSVHDDGVTFDIAYDDGDEEKRVSRDRIMHRSGACYYNAASFVREVVACDGHIVLMTVLKSHEEVQDKLTLIPVLAVLSAVVEMNNDVTVMRTLMAMCIHTVVFEILDEATACKSSSRLTRQCLLLLQHIASYSVQYKNDLFHLGAHTMSINCVSAFPSQPSVLASSLGLLASIISKDGVHHYPHCNSSGGEVNFANLENGELMFSPYWVSEDRPPSQSSPHWIDVQVTSHNRCCNVMLHICCPYACPFRWREVSMLLRDYGSASPETIIVKFRAHRPRDPLDDEEGGEYEFFEVKSYSSLDRVGGWVQIVSREEVQEAHEVCVVIS